MLYTNLQSPIQPAINYKLAHNVVVYYLLANNVLIYNCVFK